MKAGSRMWLWFSDDSFESSNWKELVAVLGFAFTGVFIMSYTEAFERLFVYTRHYQHYHIDDFIVFFPSFLALGLLLFSLDRIQVLRSEISRRREVEKELLESEKRYQNLSIIDDLTQLYNSRHLYGRLNEEIVRANRYRHPLSILLADVDNFKKYNDRYGHLEGDKVLSAVGKVLRGCLRKTDVACRYGGEEFIVILPEIRVGDATRVAERIRKKIENELFFPRPNEPVHTTVSIGVTQYEFKEEMRAFIRRADKAMYVAKGNGKNRVSTLRRVTGAKNMPTVQPTETP